MIYSNNTKPIGTGEEWSVPKKESYQQNNYCFHDNCPNCNGTGINKHTGGMCVHGIACPCPKCTPRC